MLTTSKPRDVIFTFDDITWDVAQRRGMCFPEDRLAQALLEHPRVNRLLVCNHPRSALVKLPKDRLRAPIPFPRSERVQLYEPLRLRRRDPTRLAALERSWAAYERRLRSAARRFGLERPAVVTAQPFVAGMLRLDWAGPVTLYATDDWAEHPAYRKWWRLLEESYQRVRLSGRQVCAVTQAIIDRIAPSGPHAVVPNGIEPKEWLAPAPAPAWFDALPGPRILYVGSLDARLDVVALREVAQAFCDGSVVLAGPSQDPRHLASLRGLANVHFPGPVGRSGVAALMAAADVCLLPHRRIPLTEAMSPLKLYEYLAAGRRVVASDLPPARGIDSRVTLVGPEGDFPNAVREALRAGPAPESERRRFVDRNSWARRHERILDIALA